MRRKPIFAEIARLVKLLGNGNEYRVYVHRHFGGTMNGKVQLSLDGNYLYAVGKFDLGDGDWGVDWVFLEHMDARHLLRIRNALMRDYGKRVLRKQIEIVPTE